jgi:hypothetical protein
MENKFKPIASEKTSDELLAMVYQFDEWDPEMLTAVEAELSNRNLLPPDIAEKRKVAMEEEAAILSKGKPASMAGLVIGWICVLSILGIVIGHHYNFSKTRSKYTDKSYHTYDKASRENGRYMFYVSLGVVILALLYKLASGINNLPIAIVHIHTNQ